MNCHNLTLFLQRFDSSRSGVNASFPCRQILQVINIYTRAVVPKSTPDICVSYSKGFTKQVGALVRKAIIQQLICSQKPAGIDLSTCLIISLQTISVFKARIDRYLVQSSS